MKSKHTRGEWIAVGHWVEHVDDSVPDICNCNHNSMGQDGRSDAEIIANARLIAAAPEMLKALKACHLELYQCTLQLNSEGWSTGQKVKKALALGIEAISKAEGGAA